MKKTVYLSLGSNLGDRQANLRRAIGKLMNLGDVITVSSIWEEIILDKAKAATWPE